MQYSVLFLNTKTEAPILLFLRRLCGVIEEKHIGLQIF